MNQVIADIVIYLHTNLILCQSMPPGSILFIAEKISSDMRVSKEHMRTL